MAVILASGSPRRRELMEMLKVRDLKIIPAKGEECPPEARDRRETVKALARAKCAEVGAIAAAGDTVVAADTIVWFDGKIYGKPHSEQEAFEMLTALSGATHEVYTGVAVLAGGEMHVEASARSCTFAGYRRRRYAPTSPRASRWIRRALTARRGAARCSCAASTGTFFNVMGLPLCRLDAMLKRTGMELLR